MREPVSIETRGSRNTNDIEALYGLIQDFEGRTSANFAKVNQRIDDLEGRFDSLEGKVDGLSARVDGLEGKVDGLSGKVDGIAGQLSEVLELLRKQS